MTEEDCLVLSKYVPEASMPILKNWFTQTPFILNITKKRTTKLGDFRGEVGKKICKISVNHNLNPYSFLFTLTHEYAHLLVWNKYKNKVNPHGKEWKNTFTELLIVLLKNNIFPDDLTPLVVKHAKQPKASSQADVQLTKALNNYNPTNDLVHLMELEQGTIFSLNNNRIFKKGEKRRTRYLCEEVTTKKKYLIHGVAEVNILN
ncbi:MAG: SprT-like domain-containing protein [Vicingaceae bacterium]|nr:SprT-like domain-containing protein [Vicingaceae bacterium]